MSETRRRWQQAKARQRAGWILALLAVAGAHLAVLWTASRVPATSEGRYPRPFVSFPEVGTSREAAAWVEQGLLLDPAPLLLPTVWNGAVESRADVRVPPLRAPFSLLPEAMAADPRAWAAVVDLVAAPEVVPSVLVTRGAEPWDRWGRRPLPPPILAPAGAGVTVRSGVDGAPVATLTVPETRRIEWQAAGLWSPAEFLFWVAEGGRLGFPLLVTSSGVASIDASLRDFLAGATALSLLPPGYYRLTIGP